MGVQIKVGDNREVLRQMPEKSVHCSVFSPPYFGLRDYGVEDQIGLEETPEQFVAEIVGVMREVRRVLRDDGTVWLNIGDSYSRSQETNVPQTKNKPVAYPVHSKAGSSDGEVGRGDRPGTRTSGGLAPKQLLGIPWRIAFALQADGWFLRQDIIWHKPNPMPESVQDRCTKAHEYIFLLSKSANYYYDAEAIAEEASKGDAGSRFDVGTTATHQQGRAQSRPDGIRPQLRRAQELAKQHGLTDEHIAAIRACGVTDVGKARVTQSGTGKNLPEVQALADHAKSVLGGYYREFLTADNGKRNKRSVWTVATQPFKEAHFATFPPDLIEPCILAGCPEGGTVLDPFGGAGTTGLVADRLKRNCILIELNPEYAEMSRRRIQNDAGMFAEVA